MEVPDEKQRNYAIYVISYVICVLGIQGIYRNPMTAEK